MDPDPSSTPLFFILALVAANAFLVAAEFALIALRRGRIEHNVRLGSAREARMLPSLDRLEELVFAGQVGRSTCSILLGWQAWVAGRSLLVPLGLLPWAATATAIATVVFLHATLGQQVPKLVAIHRAEWIAAHLGLPVLEALALLLKPLWPLNLLVRGLVRVFGVQSTGFQPLMQTPEEIRLLVTHGADPAEIESDEREMIRGVFEFAETVAREVMTPRTDMVAVSADIGFDDLVRRVVEEGHSRYPVFEGSVDSIVGVLLTKDLFPLLADRETLEQAGFDIRTVMRPAYFVPGTKQVSELLAELRQSKVHLAIVLDEFGGTAGLVTMEDLLEEIVGEIEDEYDEPEPDFAATPEGDVLIDGSAAVWEVNERFDLRLPDEDFDTLGGYVFGTLGRVPEVGDVVPAPGVDGAMELRVEELEERRITLVRLCRPSPAPAEAEAVASE
ncbi:MAG TPA: hemolysin family protein [Longimicrobium sp.]|nr:hemolysin family protein [Longimicrobium sp.]